MSTQKTQVSPAAQPLWTDMGADDFGQDVEAVQGSLFPEPDACGTLDLFDGLGE